jgi:hypothetical protein
MPPFKYPGPICQTKDWYDDIEDGTLARVASPLPSPVGSAAPQGTAKPARRVVAKGACSFINPQAKGTVIASPEAFGRLRKNSGAAKISSEKAKASQTWPDGSSSPAIEQEIQIDNQKISVVRPMDDKARGKNLPTIKELAEALRATPAAQRAHTNEVILSPTAAPGSTESQTIQGQGGSGKIELFPVSDRQSQNDFDNRLMHESGHNYQEKLWSGAADVSQWQVAADADDGRPSPYAAHNTGDDFCEFNILYNAAKATSCEPIAKQIYPNRWKKMEEYQSP